MKKESSRHVGIRIPTRIFDLVEEHYPDIGWSRIVREALVEKLERDTGEKIDRSLLEMTQGARNDMKTEKGRAKAEKNLAKARAKIVKRARKNVTKLALAFGKANTLAQARALAQKAVNPTD